VQRGVGGALGIMPVTIGGVVCALAGLDPTIGSEVDGGSPAYGVVADDDNGDAGYAIAMKLTDPQHTHMLLLEGETARFRAREEGTLRVLLAKANPLPLAVALARGGYLLVARNEADLARLGPYAYRTLPTKPRPAAALQIDAPRYGVASFARARAGERWGDAKTWLLGQDEATRAKHAGRAPDFGDATALLACADAVVQRRLAVLGDVESMRAELDAGDEEMHGVFTMTPASGRGAATEFIDAMHPGDTAPLLAAAQDSVVALILRDVADERASDARETEACLVRVLGTRVTEDDARRIHTTLDDWAKGRGDWLTATLEWGAAHGLLLRAPAANAESASRAVHEALELLQRPAFKEPLAKFLQVRDLSFGVADAQGLGKVNLATLTRDAPPPPSPAMKAPLIAPPPPIGIAWRATGADVDVAIGEGAPQLLASGAAPLVRLGEERRIAHALTAAEANATFAIVLQPLRLDPARAGQAPAPLVYAWGRKGHDAWARVEIADALIREIVKLQSGL